MARRVRHWIGSGGGWGRKGSFMRSGRVLGSVALTAGLLVFGCSREPASEETTETTAPGISDETLLAIEGEAAPEGEELVSYSIPPDELITPEGIGLARVGETLGDLSDAIGDQPVEFVESYDDGLSAVCVEDDDGAELFCAAFAHAAQPSEDAVVVRLSTRHPRYRTQEGVGPGVSVEDAAVVYGDAFLSLSPGGAEYVEFDRGPPGTVDFRPVAPSDPNGHVGVYDEDEEVDEGDVRETEDYRDGAIIAAVDVTAPRVN
jgi:hypothetical protein